MTAGSLTISDSNAVQVWGVPFTPITRTQAVDAVTALIEAGQTSFFITANVNYVMLSSQMPELREINRNAAFIVADGAPIVWASKRGPNPLPERVAGSDLIYDLCERAAAVGHRIFLVGGAEGVADEAAKRLVERYPGLQIVGTACPPYRDLSPEEVDQLATQIREVAPHLLIGAFSQPKGDMWMDRHRHRFGVPVCVQLGATLDFVAGRVQRAPRWIQKVGMEWAYRISTDPKRLAPRYVCNFVFLTRKVLAGTIRTRPAQGVADEMRGPDLP